MEKLEFKEAIREIMKLVENANKYYDTREPWKQKKEDIAGFNDTIYTCAIIIANLSNLFDVVMPKATAKLREYLKLGEPSWRLLQN